MSYLKAYKTISGYLKPYTIDIQKAANEGYDPKIVPTSCTSFEDLLACYQKKLHITQGFQDALATILAVNVSLKLGDLLLWLFLIGPPSSGKSTLTECMAPAHPYCFSISKLTGILSGQQGKKDCSLLPDFQGRAVIVKDFTTILSMPETSQELIFGELRDMYDGSTVAKYRTGVKRTYNDIRFAMIAAVTDAIRAHNDTEMGSRFLQIEIDSHWDEFGRLQRHASDGMAHFDRALLNMITSIPDAGITSSGDLAEQKQITWGFLDHIHNLANTDKHFLSDIMRSIASDHEFKMYVKSLADWTAYSRATVKRDREKCLIFRPRIERGLRLGKQLIKTAVALCVVFQLDRPNDYIKSIVRKIALDTGNCLQQEIMQLLSVNPQGMKREQIADHVNLSPQQISNILNNMRELQAVSTSHNTTVAVTAPKRAIPTRSTVAGRPPDIHRLHPELAQIAINLNFRN